jgi:hypothetical protein
MTYPGEEESDRIGRAKAIEVLLRDRGWVLIEHDKYHIIDLQRKDFPDQVEVELSHGTRFVHGKYTSSWKEHSPGGVISIAARKRSCLEIPFSWWMTFDDDLTHYIILRGEFILKNCWTEWHSNNKKPNGEKEEFIVIRKELGYPIYKI